MISDLRVRALKRHLLPLHRTPRIAMTKFMALVEGDGTYRADVNIESTMETSV